MKPVIGITCSDNVTAGKPIMGVKMDYLRAVEAAGGVPVLLSPTDPKSLPQLLKNVQGVIITGSDDIHPKHYGQPVAARLALRGRPVMGKHVFMTESRFQFESALVRHAARIRLPVLGICGGLQMMNVVWGGTLFQDLSMAGVRTDRHVKGRHPVTLLKGSRLAKWMGRREISVTTHHHQAVERLGEGWRVTALSPDGVVEAVEQTGHIPQVGVEWHPEMDWRLPLHLKLFKGFVTLTQNRGLW